jgi:cobalt/nickel transport system ATP-binding protein
MITATGVRFAWSAQCVALDRIDFRVADGEFVALLASNGSGKTTLMKVLAGLLAPQQGEVVLDGRPVRAWSDAERFRRLGLVLQDPDDQLFGATVAEDVAAGPRNLDLPEDEVQRLVAGSLDAVGAGHLAGRAIHHLSFGERKRVCLAGILAMGPRLLICDEPTAGLDPQGEAAMLRLLHRVNREQGRAILLATHTVDLLPLFADRIVVLNRGRVLMDGPPAEIFAEPEILARAGLRLPWVSHLLHELQCSHGLPVERLPLTLGEAREELLRHLPDSAFTGRQP